MKTLHIKSISVLLGLIFSIGLFAQSEQVDQTEDDQPVVRNGVVYLTDSTGPHTLTLEVIKLDSNEGKVMMTLMTEEQVPIAHTKATIIDETCHVVMDNLPAGNYVVRYYHDENENGELDTAAYGIPTEGYGSSNDARGFMGPPAFEDMIFELNEDVNLKMKTVN